MNQTPATSLLENLDAALAAGEPFRADLPAGGTVFVDHAALLLVVHRRTKRSGTDPAHEAAATDSAAHRLASVASAHVIDASGTDGDLPALVQAIAERVGEVGGALLVVEVWTALGQDGDDIDPFGRRPGFAVFVPVEASGPLRYTADALADALSGIEVAGQGAEVSEVSTDAPASPGRPPLLSESKGTIGLIGLAVDAIYVNERDGEFYPGVLADLRSALAPALDRAASTFARATSAPMPKRASGIGRRHLEPAAHVVDQGLSACSDAFGFLLQVTPVNGAAAWEEFSTGSRKSAPELLYRPLTFDPDAVRRQLFNLPLEQVDDPVVADLLREKRDETAAKIQMILNIETPSFLPGSIALYGAPDTDVLTLAHQLVAALPESSVQGVEQVGATVFAAHARAEIEHLQAQWNGVDATVEIRHDMTGRLMVSSGRLLVGGHALIAAERIPALLAHEVGTHVLTFYNGKAQPLRLLQHGTAGYEGLQEGLAVLSEWLVGGLNAERFRTLAARVIGADALARGAEFPETVRRVGEAAGLGPRAAFDVALRLHRGGGLTKDLIYLSGLRDLLAHLAGGAEFWPLLAGKMGLHHLPALEALTERGILIEPRVRPRWSSDPQALARLDRARKGITVLDLVAEA